MVKLGSWFPPFCSRRGHGWQKRGDQQLRALVPQRPPLILLWVFAHGHKEGTGFKCSAAERPLVMCLFLLCLLKSNIYIWHILGCCHGNGCIDTSIAEQLCSVQKDQKDDGWERKRPVLSIQAFIIFILQLLSSSWKAYSCWIGVLSQYWKNYVEQYPTFGL